MDVGFFSSLNGYNEKVSQCLTTTKSDALTRGERPGSMPSSAHARMFPSSYHNDKDQVHGIRAPADGGGGAVDDKYNHRGFEFQVIDFHQTSDGFVVLAGVGLGGDPVVIKIKGFEPGVMIAPTDPEKDRLAWESLVGEVLTTGIKAQAMFPLCGYTNASTTVIRVSGKTQAVALKKAYEIVSDLNLKMFDVSVHIDLGIIKEMSAEQEFFHRSGLRPCAMAVAENCRVAVKRVADREYEECCCDFDDLVPCDNVKSIPPATICAFDIECNSHTGGFPDPTNEDDFIEQIGLFFKDMNGLFTGSLIMLSRQDTRSGGGSPLTITAPVEGGEIEVLFETFDGNEALMLLRFCELVRKNKTVHLVAHNGFGFDVPYIVKRAKKCGIYKEVLDGLSYFGSVRPCVFKERQIENNMLGKYDIGEINPFGLVVHDTMIYFRKAFKLSSYSLNSLSDEFLGGRQKLEMTPREMFRLFQQHPLIPGESVADARAKMENVARYCAVDCVLTMDIVMKMHMIPALMGLSTVTISTLQAYILTGEQRKSFNVICQKAESMGYYINRSALPTPPEGYQGATVLEPTIGYHDRPIIGLDFSSLYPSIMQAYNLCFSTCEWNGDSAARCREVRDADRDEYDHVVFEGGSHVSKTVSFVKEGVRLGVLPSLLCDLLEARKDAKRKMKNSETPFEVMIYDQLQRAFKITCNSIYGFCGVSGNRDDACTTYPRCFSLPWKDKNCGCYRGLLSNCWIAQTVTKCGRHLIDETAKFVTKNWTGSRVVYGDTDSCYIDAGLPPTLGGMREAHVVGSDMAARVTEIFPYPIKMEYEKTMWPFIQLRKKRYVYVAWELGAAPKRDAKGVESQRRDNSAWLRRIFNGVSDILLPIPDPDGDDIVGIDKDRIVNQMLEYIRVELTALVENRVDHDLFTISRSLGENYVNQQVHSVLANKIRERVQCGDMTRDVPRPGDRMSYVIVQGPPKSKVSDRGEDPLWIAENPAKCQPLDRVYYAEKTRDAVVRLTDDVDRRVHGLFEDAIRRLPTYRALDQPSISSMFKRMVDPGVVNGPCSIGAATMTNGTTDTRDAKTPYHPTTSHAKSATKLHSKSKKQGGGTSIVKKMKKKSSPNEEKRSRECLMKLFKPKDPNPHPGGRGTSEEALL
jgi:DNA polymerase elongation subunit (family B)